jgi:hypothetical protein
LRRVRACTTHHLAERSRVEAATDCAARRTRHGRLVKNSLPVRPLGLTEPGEDHPRHDHAEIQRDHEPPLQPIGNARLPNCFPDALCWEAEPSTYCSKCLISFGALGEIRTPDPRNRNPMLGLHENFHNLRCANWAFCKAFERDLPGQVPTQTGPLCSSHLHQGPV